MRVPIEDLTETHKLPHEGLPVLPFMMPQCSAERAEMWQRMTPQCSAERVEMRCAMHDAAVLG